METTLPDGLVRAYHETHYEVRADLGFTLRIGERSSQLIKLFEKKGLTSAAFLTAWNPWSEPRSAEENDTAQMKLIATLEPQFELIPGIGVHPNGEWPGEESMLVLGISQERAEEVGRHFGQNALVWIGRSGVPELLLLK